MFLREIIGFFWVQNCLFREMIISDNTERGNLKLLMPKKKRMKRKIYQQRNAAEIQSETYIAAEVFLLLTCDQVFCLFSVFASVRGGLHPIAIQSNHLLGNPRDTLT